MSKSTPDAPDYEAAAEKQAQSSREVTEQQTWANRPDQYTPWGSTTWENEQVWDPSTSQYLNRWTQNTNLTPDSQAALDAQLDLTRERSELGLSMTDRMRDEYGTAMDWGSVRQGGGSVDPRTLQSRDLQNSYDIEGPDLNSAQRYSQQAEDALYGRWADRALPQQARDEEALRTQLYNMGAKEGDPIYDEEMRKLREGHGDQQRQAAYDATIGAGEEAQRYLGMDQSTRAQLTGENRDLAGFGNQAALGEFGMDQTASGQNFGQEMQSSQYDTQLRQQQIAEIMQQRGFTLNEINALLTGQQVNMPSMPGFNTAQRSEGNQALQAAQLTGQAELDRYNAQQQATQGMMSGIGSMAGGFMMSDRRMKTDVVHVGETANGTPLYSFRYIGGGPAYFGVMADEVPHAVVRINGIDYVDYSKVH